MSGGKLFSLAPEARTPLRHHSGRVLALLLGAVPNGRAWLAVALLCCVDAVATPCRAQTHAIDDQAPAAPTCMKLPGRPDLEAVLSREFETPDGFCKDPDYSLDFDEVRMCSVAEAAARRCPGFAEACARRTRSFRVRTPPHPVTSLLGSILTYAFWTLLIIGVLLLLRSLVAWLVRRARESEHSTQLEGGLQASVSTPGPAPSSHAPEALLAQARDLAARGAFKEAMAKVLAALLSRLEISGVLELHPAHTNGEYLRQLRSNRHLADEFRRVAVAVETVEFGGKQGSHERFAELLERVTRVMGSLAAIVLLIGAGLIAGCSRPPLSPGGGAASCGTGPAGYSVLCDVLGMKGGRVRKRYQRVHSIAADVRQIVVVRDVLDAPEQKALRDWAAAGGTLVVMSEFDRYVRGLKLGPPHEWCQGQLSLEGAVGGTGENAPVDSSSCARATGRLPEAQLFRSAGNARELVRCGKAPFAVRAIVGAGSIVAIADPRWVMNAALAIEGNGALVTEVLQPSTATVELIGTWTSSGSGLPLSSLIRAGLLPWLLHMALLGLAFALYRGAPFGTRRDVGVPPRRAFVEHVQALGDAYARAHASRIALSHSGSWALDRLRIRTAASGQARLSELAAAIASRFSLAEAQAMRLVVAVRSAADEEHDSADEAEHLAVVRELSALVRKAGRQS